MNTINTPTFMDEQSFNDKNKLKILNDLLEVKYPIKYDYNDINSINMI